MDILAERGDLGPVIGIHAADLVAGGFEPAGEVASHFP